MIAEIAKRRFNYVDSVAQFVLFYNVGAGNIGTGFVVWVALTILSAALEIEAKAGLQDERH